MDFFTIGERVKELDTGRVGRIVDVAEDGVGMLRMADKTRVVVCPEDCEPYDEAPSLTRASVASLQSPVERARPAPAEVAPEPAQPAVAPVDPDICPGCHTRNPLRQEVVKGGRYAYRCLELVDEHHQRVAPLEVGDKKVHTCGTSWEGGEAAVPAFD